MMKKIIIALLCLQLINLPTFASTLIEDSFAEKTLQNEVKVEKQNVQTLIEDKFVNSSLKNKTHIQKIDKPNIDDLFVEKTLSNQTVSKPKKILANISDDFADKTLKKVIISNSKANLNYDFESVKRVSIKISSLENITTKNGLKEGQTLQFKVIKDVKLDNERTIKKDSIVNARLETISPNQAFGVPADMIVDKFVIKQQNQEDLILDGNVHEIGANRSLWVYPVGYMGGIVFFGAGFLLFTVRGGHAKIKTKDSYEVYYVPKSI